MSCLGSRRAELYSRLRGEDEELEHRRVESELLRTARLVTRSALAMQQNRINVWEGGEGRDSSKSPGWGICICYLGC